MRTTPPSRRYSRWAIPAIVHLTLGVVLTVLLVYARCAVGYSEGFNRFVGMDASARVYGPLMNAPGSVWDKRCWTWQTWSSIGMRQCHSCVHPPRHRVNNAEPPVASSVSASAARLAAAPPWWAECHDPTMPPDPSSPLAKESLRTLGVEAHDSVFGWPFLCMTMRMGSDFDIGGRVNTVVHGVRFHIPFMQSRFNHDGLWPTHILWPGMIGNVLVWAMISTLPRFAWRGVKAWRSKSRTKHGRCPRCGYDRASLAASSPCPECGSV